MSLPGVQPEKGRHHEKLHFFSPVKFPQYVSLSVEVSGFVPLQWKLLHARLYLDCKWLICNKAAMSFLILSYCGNE